MLVEATKLETAFLKVGIYGMAASGKTTTSLKIATALWKTAVVDTQNEIIPLRDVFKNPDGTPLLVAQTRNVNDIPIVVEECLKEKVQCLIIDQMTTLWDEVQEDFLSRECQKGSKMWQAIKRNDGTIPFSGWRFIKKPYNSMLYYLLNAPIHVFILARETREYEVSPGGEPKQVGERMSAERNTQYYPQILIRMEFNKRQGKRFAYVERDRWLQIEGKTFVNPDVEMLRPVLAKLGTTHTPLPPSAYSVSVEEPVRRGPTAAQEKLLRILAQREGVDDTIVDAALAVIGTERAAAIINDLTIHKCDTLLALSDVIQNGAAVTKEEA